MIDAVAKKVSESDTKGEKEMQKSIEELAGCICGKICQKPSEITDQEEMEEYCNGVCQFPTHLCNIMNQYSKRNDSGNSELYESLRKYQNIVLCKECQYGTHVKETNSIRCELSQGLKGILDGNDGCSYGKRCPTRTPENKGCN